MFCKTVIRRYKPTLIFQGNCWFLSFIEHTKYRQRQHSLMFENELYDVVVKKANQAIIDWQKIRWAEMKETAERLRNERARDQKFWY